MQREKRRDLRLIRELSRRSVELMMYDPTGREVYELVDGPMDAGKNRIIFDTITLAAGVYVVRLDAGGLGAVTKRVVVTR